MNKPVAKTINVAPGVELPLALIGQKNAILGMSGAGKSNTAAALAEEMHAAGAPWVAIDPKGDWYGVRSSQDGKGAGLDVPVIGGRFGDLPLPPDAGARLGELAAKGQLRGVIDISDFDTDAQRSRFMADLGRALLKHANGTLVHFFCDECHEYMPQPGGGGRLDGPAAECVGVWKKVATKLRTMGVGFTLLSQRAALVNKTVLYQCDTLIAMRMVGKRDKDAVSDWAADMGDAKELIRSLPLLEDGEAWIWSPQRLKITQRVKIRRRHTYDSGRTPEFGSAVVAPKFAQVDIEALRGLLVEQGDGKGEPANKWKGAQGPDLAELQALREEVPALRKENIRLTTAVAEANISRQNVIRALVPAVQKFNDLLRELHGDFDGLPRLPTSPTKTAVPPGPGRAIPILTPEQVVARHADDPPFRPEPSDSEPDAPPTILARQLTKCARGILTALVQLGPQNLTQAAIAAGYAQDSGGVRNAAGELRAAGYVDGTNAQLTATSRGKAALGKVKPLPRGPDLLAFWQAKLAKAEREILQQVVNQYPKALDLTTAARRCNYAPDSGGVRNAAGRLRTLALVDGPNAGMTANERLIR